MRRKNGSTRHAPWRARGSAIAALLWTVLGAGAFAEEPARLPAEALSALLPPPPCVPASSLDPVDLERMRRFLVVPEGYGRWRERDCFPPRLDETTLARTLRPFGVIVAVAGADAFVVDPGGAWLGECARTGLEASGARPVTGADLARVIDRIARDPTLAAADIREIGLGMGTQAGNGHPLYSLTLGTPRAVVRIQCFEDVDLLVERAAAALQQARQATVW